MARPALNNEPHILQQVAKGDEQAFTDLYHHYSGRVFHVALKMLRSQSEAEETVQEVFLKIWAGREKLREIRSFADYLFIITRNLVYSRFSRKALEIRAGEVLSGSVQTVSNTDLPMIEKEYAALLKQAVRQLPPQQSHIFHLAREEGKSHQEIAELLNLSRLTVKKHMALALKTIRASLQDHLK